MVHKFWRARVAVPVPRHPTHCACATSLSLPRSVSCPSAFIHAAAFTLREPKGLRPSEFRLPNRRPATVRSSLDSKVSNMTPKGLYPPEPEDYRGPKLKVAIIGAGLAGMSTAVELLDQGHEVDIYESLFFVGGKVGSFMDRHGNHIEMGLHVFFGCYSNLFRLMKKVGADKNLLVKDHTHTFINKGGEIGELDFRFPLGAPIHGIRPFLATNQLKDYIDSMEGATLSGRQAAAYVCSAGEEFWQHTKWKATF